MRAQRARRSRFNSLAEEPEDDSNDYDDCAPSEESEGEQPATRRFDAAAATASAETSSEDTSGTKTKDSDRDISPKPSLEEPDDEFQVQDNNDELCSVCSSKKDSDKLLCCELCPRVYHLYCLKPPLKKVPDGDWYCYHCQKSLGLDNIEKFLAARTRAVDLDAEKAAEQAAEQQAAQQASATAGKKRTAPDVGPLSTKRPKMASVQQLHTGNPLPAGSASQSRSVSPGKSSRAGSTGRENSVPQQATHSATMPDTQLDVDAADHAGPTATLNSAHGADSTERVVAGEAQPGQHAAVGTSAKQADSDAALREAGTTGKKDAVKLTEVKEYFVKWKNKSYIHCSWLKHDDVVRVAKVSAGLNMRFKHYQRSVYGMPQVESSAKLEDQEAGELVNGIDPLWVLVERVVATQEKKSSGTHYLVKWKGLGYEECTWEAAADLLPKFRAEIERFKEQHPIANELAQRKRSHSQASTSQAGATRSAAGRKLGTRKFADSPSFLAGGGSLHPYQLEGLNWLFFAWEQSKHVILADEMGLGKTIQSIAFLAALKCTSSAGLVAIAMLQEEHVQRPHLVVVPLSTFPNWQREFALWAPQLNVVPFIGNQTARNVIKQHELYADSSQHKTKAKTGSRNADLQARVKFHVLLTTYEMVGYEAGTLRSLEWETLLVDEGHRLKNQQSKLFQQLHNFKTWQRTLLTGTPLQNNLAELFMLLHFLDAGKFQSLQDFEANYSDFSHGEQITKLHELLSPHLLRRLKKDVLKQLPPKKEQIVRVELSPLQKDWYRGILTKNFPNLTNGKQAGRLKSVMMELRKCCNHPFLIDEQPWPVTGDPKQFLQELLQASGKLALVDSMLERMKPLGHRVLIYSQFTTLLNLLEEWLTARQWGFQRIDGSVGSAERQSRIDQFNTRPADNFVFLLSTKAGGLGINLASADTVVIYDSDWNPHNDLQAQARAHRLGQLKPVMIYRLVTRLTIEERMMQQAKKKLVLEHLVVHKLNTAADLKQDELDDILRYGAAELFADAAKAQQAAAAGEGNTAETAAGGKSASDKAEKIIRLSEREQAEGRTGGQAGHRIVYDDAAIERLLDRSDLANAEEDKADEKEDDFVKGFKVANFEIIESPDKGEKAGNEDSATEVPETAEAQQPASVFWNELLKSGYQDLQQVQMAALGKGKRERRQVNYDEKGDKGREDGSDYSALSEDSGDDSDGKPAMKKQRSDVVNMTEAQARAAQAVVQQRQASLGAGKPLTTGAFASLKVLGFSSAQRAQFMKVLMQFGLGQQLAGGKFDWSHIHRHMAAKWPPLTLDHTCRYAELVMLQLSEPANQLPFFADGILKKDILHNYELNKVLDRLGTLHLVRHTLLKQMTEPDNTFSLGPAYAATLRPFKYWQAEHDKRLLYGVLKHGWAQWQVILKDHLLGIEPVLRKELFLPQRQIQQALSVPSSTASPASGQAPAAPADDKGQVGSSTAKPDTEGVAAGDALKLEQAAANVNVQLAVTDSGTVQLQLSPDAAKSAQADGLQPQQQQQQQQASGTEGGDAAAADPIANQLPHGIPVKPVVKEDVIDLADSTSQAQPTVQSSQPDPKAVRAAQSDTPAGVQPSLGPEQQQAQTAAARSADLNADPGGSQTATKADSSMSISDAAPGMSAAGGSAGTAAPQGVFGCPKCRWAPKGCAVCRARAQASTSPAGTAARSSNTSHDSAERASMYKMTTWLMNRTSTLCHALKQSHQGTPAPKPPPKQTSITVSAPSTKLVPSSSTPVMQTHQVKLSQAPPTTIMKFPSVPAVTGGASAQWQQQQLSQLRQQQRVLQQQQLAEAQRQQQQMLLMQQQQRQHHTSLLRQQHQTAQLQQQQQRQAAQAQTASSQALQQQQQRMRQQQQGLQQRQLEQQRQQQMQQQLLQQQQQRQLSAQQQVQYALSRQGSGQQQGQQPRPAAVFASAAQHAQYQQQQQGRQPSSSGAYIGHPLSQPDKAAPPVLMTLQQPHLRSTSLPRSPSLPASPSLPHQQSMRQYVQYNSQSHAQSQTQAQSQSQAGSQSQSQAVLQPGQIQQQRQQGVQSGGQQSSVSPLDPAFRLLSDVEKTRVLRNFLLKSKPNLQPIDLHKLFKQTGMSPSLPKQALQDRLHLVDSYNKLCGRLLDVQVTLAQNKPHSMTDHDRNVAAIEFQHSMQGMEQLCAGMVQNLQSNYISLSSPSPASLQPVLQGQGHHHHQGHHYQTAQQQYQSVLAAASRDSPGAVSPARLQFCEPSAHCDAAGRSDDLGKGSPRVDGQRAEGGGLASLITPTGVASSSPAPRPAAGVVPASHEHADVRDVPNVLLQLPEQLTPTVQVYQSTQQAGSLALQTAACQSCPLELCNAGSPAPEMTAAQASTSSSLQDSPAVQTGPVQAADRQLHGHSDALSVGVAEAVKHEARLRSDNDAQPKTAAAIDLTADSDEDAN